MSVTIKLNMKKLITTIFTFSTLISFAQISYGVKAGYTNSTMKWKEEGIQVEFDPKASFYIGSFIENKSNSSKKLFIYFSKLF